MNTNTTRISEDKTRLFLDKSVKMSRLDKSVDDYAAISSDVDIALEGPMKVLGFDLILRHGKIALSVPITELELEDMLNYVRKYKKAVYSYQIKQLDHNLEEKTCIVCSSKFCGPVGVGEMKYCNIACQEIDQKGAGQ